MKKILLAAVSKPVLIIILIILVLLLISAKNEQANERWYLNNQNSISDIDLTNSIDKDSVAGAMRGFVVLDNINDQPKNARQYFVIESNLDTRASEWKYDVEEIVKLNALPPTSLGHLPLSQLVTASGITLTDSHGNQFIFNDNTQEVRVLFSNGESARLITDNDMYRDFWWDIFTGK